MTHGATFRGISVVSLSALGFATKTLRTYRFSSILATCPTHRILPDLTTYLLSEYRT